MAVFISSYPLMKMGCSESNTVVKLITIILLNVDIINYYYYIIKFYIQLLLNNTHIFSASKLELVTEI